MSSFRYCSGFLFVSTLLFVFSIYLPVRPYELFSDFIHRVLDAWFGSGKASTM